MAHELKQKLLPPRPPTPPPGVPVATQKGVTLLRPPTPPLGASSRGQLALPDLLQLKKRGAGVRSWICIDWKGHVKTMEADKVTIMRRCHLPARDLRLLDPVFVYPSTILGRERAMVVNLEHIRCIITAEECLVLNATDGFVQEYKKELQRRILQGGMQSDREHGGFLGRGTGGQVNDRILGEPTEGMEPREFWQAPSFQSDGPRSDHDMFSGAGIMGEDQPFEFKALEVALEAACTYLDAQASELSREAYPLLEQLAYQISTRNLELVRRLKSNLVQLTRRVQKVRDEVEQLMDDDGDMAEMYLTEKKRRLEASSHHGGDAGFGSLAVPQSPHPRPSLSAPVSPVGSPPRELAGSQHGGRGHMFPFEREGTVGSHYGSMLSGVTSASTQASEVEDVDQLEMLLEAYFVVIDGTLNKLTQMSQYIDDTEDFINIQLDNVRNQLIQFELLLTTATFVVAMYGVVAGIFGMNVPLGLEDDENALPWILCCTGLGGITVFLSFIGYFRWKNLTIV